MNIEEAIKELSVELKRKSLIPVCGAGISKPSGLPLGKELMSENKLTRSFIKGV